MKQPTGTMPAADDRDPLVEAMRAHHADFRRLVQLHHRRPSLWRWIRHLTAGRQLQHATATEVISSRDQLYRASMDWIDARWRGPQDIPPFSALRHAVEAVASTARQGDPSIEAGYYYDQARRRGYRLGYAFPDPTDEQLAAFWNHAASVRAHMTQEEFDLTEGRSRAPHSVHHVVSSPGLQRLGEIVAAHDGLPSQMCGPDGRMLVFRTESFEERRLHRDEQLPVEGRREVAPLRERKQWLDGLSAGDEFCWQLHPRSASANPAFVHWSEDGHHGRAVEQLRHPREDSAVYFAVLARSGMVVPPEANPQPTSEMEVLLPTTVRYRVLGREQHSYRDAHTAWPHQLHRIYLVLEEI